MSQIIVPDTSIIIEGIISKKIEKKELDCKEILLHEAVIAELEHQANNNIETGFLGLEEIKKLIGFSKKHNFRISYEGEKPNLQEIKSAKKGGIDSLIRNLAFEKKALLVTGDKVQALVAESKGVSVMLIDLEIIEKKISLEKYFDSATMSVHLKENCTPKAKKGKPGNWQFVELEKNILEREYLKELSKEISEIASLRADSFIEIQRKGSTIVQLMNYRIVITKPPFSDGWEITAVRPVKKLKIEDYQMTNKLRERLGEKAEGILVSGAPGMGKSTFVQALGEFYLKKDRIIKTVEAPRDLVLSEEVTQYAMSHGSNEEIHDILLLTRPDYTLFDEMRNTSDFRLFADLRLSGVGMVGVVHATNPIDAIQRFVGRIELGVIPHIIDTVIFIQNGQIGKVLEISLKVKVPSGMTEADLARPVVTVNDFESGKLEFEMYSYGEETVVVPVSANEKASNPVFNLAEEQIKKEFSKYDKHCEVEVLADNKCVVFVSEDKRAKIIGRNGENISRIEKELGMSIDIKTRSEKESKTQIQKKTVNYEVMINKKNIMFKLDNNNSYKDTDIFVEGEYLMTVKASKKAMVKISRSNKIGKIIIQGLEAGKVELKQ